MKYHELTTQARRNKKRVGRGIAAGQGKTAGRGTKGQKSRTGSKKRPGFEGGQNPLMQRLPKLPGFRSMRPKIETIYTGQLDSLKDAVDTVVLAQAGLISNPYVKTKLIVKGPVTKKHTVKLPAASETAIAAVQKAGGSFTKVKQLMRAKSVAKEEAEKK